MARLHPQSQRQPQILLGQAREQQAMEQHRPSVSLSLVLLKVNRSAMQISLPLMLSAKLQEEEAVAEAFCLACSSAIRWSIAPLILYSGSMTIW